MDTGPLGCPGVWQQSFGRGSFETFVLRGVDSMDWKCSSMLDQIWDLAEYGGLYETFMLLRPFLTS